MRKKWLLRQIISMLLVASFNFPCLADTKKVVKIDKEQSLILIKAKNNLEDIIENFEKDTKIVEIPNEFEKNQEKLKGIFRSAISEAKATIIETQDVFQKTSTKSKFLLSSNVFFGDLNVHYEYELKEVEELEDKREEYIKVRDNVINLLKDNQLAYDIAATAALLTFNLTITTVPKGASVYYKRKGSNYEESNKATKLILENLDLAKWYVKVHVDGYVDEEKPYNPFKETSNELEFDLKPVSKD